MAIKNATLADLPALTSLMLASLPPDYQWKYCFPSSAKLKQDPAKYVENALQQCLEPGNVDWLVCVAREPGTNRIVSAAIWSLTDTEIKDDADGAAAAKDATVAGAALGGGVGKGKSIAAGEVENATTYTRIHALSEAVAAARARHLARFGQQMILYVVTTHPHFQRQGYAKELCRHGMQLAAERELAVSAVASPMGYIFFSEMGFVDFGHVPVHVEGEKEEIGLKAMVFAAPPKRRGSLLEILGFGERRRSMVEVRRLSSDRRSSHG